MFFRMPKIFFYYQKSPFINKRKKFFSGKIWKMVYMNEFPMIFKTKICQTVGATSGSRNFTKIRTDTAHHRSWLCIDLSAFQKGKAGSLIAFAYCWNNIRPLYRIFSGFLLTHRKSAAARALYLTTLKVFYISMS